MDVVNGWQASEKPQIPALPRLRLVIIKFTDESPVEGETRVVVAIAAREDCLVNHCFVTRVSAALSTVPLPVALHMRGGFPLQPAYILAAIADAIKERRKRKHGSGGSFAERVLAHRDGISKFA